MGEKFLTVNKDSMQLLGGNIDDYPGGDHSAGFSGFQFAGRCFAGCAGSPAEG